MSLPYKKQIARMSTGGRAPGRPALFIDNTVALAPKELKDMLDALVEADEQLRELSSIIRGLKQRVRSFMKKDSPDDESSK